MKNRAPHFPRSYRTALGRYLQEGSTSNLLPARRLGLRAVKSGRETLELAKIHEQALLALLPSEHSPRTADAMIRRAGIFFAAAITPIEAAQDGDKQAGVDLRVVIQSLSHRSVELASANEKLEKEIVQRKAVEDSLRISEQTTSALLGKSLTMQEELRHLSRRLLSAQEEERMRISRELHDVIAQALTGINVRLAALQSQSTTNTRDLHKNISVTQRLVEKSVDLVHRFARDLRPSVLDDLGLIPALHAYLKSFLEQTGIRVAFTVYAGVEGLDNASLTVLYRVAQEALVNVARHAKASRASLKIYEKDTRVCLEIRDNGRGFPLEGTRFAKNNKRLGMLGMRERVEMIGGTFSVASVLGKQTTICVEIPPGGRQAKTSSSRKSHPATVQPS